MTSPVDAPALFAGEWNRSADDSWLPVYNPADLRQTVARVPALSSADISRSVRCCRDRRTHLASDGCAFSRSRDAGRLEILRERNKLIADDLVAEMGKTFAEASVEVTKAADFFEYYGAMAPDATGLCLERCKAEHHRWRSI